MAQKVILGADHAGFELKEKLKSVFKENEIVFDDLSLVFDEKDDYPDVAFKVAKRVAREKNLGVLICGTGIGMCMTANKVKGVRAALAYDENTARLSRQHNDANILCLGGRTTDEKLAKRILKVWLNTRFLEGRHLTRVEKIRAFENE
jgi:ribose 5-phosphate isomerase B